MRNKSYRYIEKKLEITNCEFIKNEKFLSCINEMRNFAQSRTEDLKCPVMRLFQIEEWLTKHIEKQTISSNQPNSEKVI